MNAIMADHAYWSRPGLHAQVVRVRQDGRHEAALHIDKLHQPQQVLQLESSLRSIPGVHRLQLDLTARRLRAVWDPQRTSLPQLLDTCSALGSPARPLSVQALDNPRRNETHAALKRLIVAGLFAMQAMMFASVLYIGHFDAVDSATRQLFRWLGLLAATPVVAWAAIPFYRSVFKALRKRRLDTDTPVAVAVALIYLASLVAAVRGQGEIYFDSISMLVLVLLVGRYLEMRARHRSGALGEAASDAAPIVAERRRADGGLDKVAVTELVVGDEVHVSEGGVVPADGRLSNARVRVDEALLSGESRPLSRQRGDAVVAGSVVLDGPLEMRVERIAARSTLASLGALADRVGRQQSASEDPLAARFAATVLLLTLATAAFWLLVSPERAFDAAVAVLVVACPCAFALAAPVVAHRALSQLGRHGVWLARPRALQALARADHALFDKTGTLTHPRLQIDAITTPRGDDPVAMLHLAASLARESSHPLSRMIADAAGDASLPQAQSVEVVVGGGVRACVDGRKLHLGRAAFVSEQALPDTFETAMLLADDQGPLAAFPFSEMPRKGARESLQFLREDGMELEILSGDAQDHVARLAASLDVRHWHARQSPEQKLQRLQHNRAAGAVLLAVGDGSNDAPLLAAADVSVAMLGGTELAQAHADLLLGDGLHGLPMARRVARRAQAILAQNRYGAMAYNLAAVPFAAAGLVPPWLAVIGMCLSSLCVVLNAMRIRDSAAKPARLAIDTGEHSA